MKSLKDFNYLLSLDRRYTKTESEIFRGKPLIDIQTVVSLIASTSTKTGLKVVCQPDNNVYLRGVAITDEEFDRILLEPVGDFGNWNYIIRGFKKGT